MLVYKTSLFLNRPTIGDQMDVSERALQGTFFTGGLFLIHRRSLHDWLVPLWARLILLVIFRRIREVGEEIDGTDCELLAEKVS